MRERGDAAAVGERRALFRLVAPGPGGHHYATLREHPAGPERFTLEVRRGLVWGSTQPVLLVRADLAGDGGLDVSVAAAQGAGELAGHLAGADLASFAAEALRLAAGRLGVDPGAFFAAAHVDLGESGTLGVEASVRERSAELLEAAAGSPAAGAPARKAAAPPAVEVPAHAGGAIDPPRSDGGSVAAVSGGVRTAAPVAAPAPPAGPVTPVESPPAEAGPATPRGEPVAPAGLLGRIVGWLRRAARAAFGG